jgi:hypothetical protein
MDVRYKYEKMEIMILCSFHESWDHLVTQMWFSTKYTIEYDIVVGSLSFKEVKIKFSLETSTLEGMMARGRSIERGEDSSGTTRAKSNGKNDKGSCWYYNKSRNLKKDCLKRKEFEEDTRKEENLAEAGLCMVNDVLSIFSISQYQEEVSVTILFTLKFWKMVHSLPWCYMFMICMFQAKAWLRLVGLRLSWLGCFR